MVDKRIEKLAEILTDYSVKIKKKSTVQINFDVDAKDLALEVYKKVLKKGAYAKLNPILPGFKEVFFGCSSDDQLKYLPKLFLQEAKLADAVITISASNYRELSRIPSEKIGLWQKSMKPISDVRLKQNNWVLCGYPSVECAKDANMCLKDFRDFVYGSTNIDWSEMSKRQDLLKSILDKGKEVHIIGEDTDLKMSIKGRKGIKCDGKFNMPDGEVFTSPRKDTVNGKVKFSFPTVYNGTEVEGVVLEFKDGKVISSSASENAEFLSKMLDVDSGARFLGELGIGMNYGIKNFIKNTLFDEKIGGTIHLALGHAYKEAGGKNQSAIHWDMVTRPEKVLVDGKVILKNGEFLF